MRIAVAKQAKDAGRTFQEIGDVLEKPRQAVQRKLKSSQSRGLTDPQFDGRDSSTLRYWYDWLGDQIANGKTEPRRDFKKEQAQVFAELDARYDAGILRKPPPGGLKELSNG